MTSAIARPARQRYVRWLVMAMLLGGCGSSPPSAPVRVVDVIRELDQAEKRPPAAFIVGSHEIDGVTHPAIGAAVPSRLTLALPLPRRGVLHAFVAPAEGSAPARLRVGVSDDRIYEGLAELTLTAAPRAWTELRVDLSAYAGWKWSLFYRPDRTIWHLVLATDPVNGAPATVLWGAPEIVTDTASAREYAARRQRLR